MSVTAEVDRQAADFWEGRFNSAPVASQQVVAQQLVQVIRGNAVRFCGLEVHEEITSDQIRVGCSDFMYDATAALACSTASRTRLASFLAIFSASSGGMISGSAK